jgi:hypothetical protein
MPRVLQALAGPAMGALPSGHPEYLAYIQRLLAAEDIAADVAAEANAKGGDAAAPAKEGEVVTSGAVLLTGAGAIQLLHGPM